MGYTDKGNLTGVMSEHACADELLNYAPVVMAAVKKLDPEVAYMQKTEKWLKLRVHGVALGRYMSEGGLEVARGKIELMIGEHFPFAPCWIKGDTLAERYESGSIKRSTMVLTAKSKKTADVIPAKGLSFGGRRHEVDRSLERGEGGMCMRCCSRDHFGQCNALYVQVSMKGASTNALPEAVERDQGRVSTTWQNVQTAKDHTQRHRHGVQKGGRTERLASRKAALRSSPPAMESAAGLDDLSMEEDQAEMEMTPAEQEQWRVIREADFC